MADKNEAKKSENDGRKGPTWGGFKGTPVAGSFKEGDAVEGKGVASAEFTSAAQDGAEAKTHTVIAYKDEAAAKLKAAVEAGTEVVVRGPMLGSAAKGTFHFGASTFQAPAEPKAELTEEEKAAKAEERAQATAERIAEADKTRTPVVAGSVAAGDEITVNGDTVSVEGLGSEWELDEAGVERLKERFPDAEGIEVGAKVQFAKFTAPEPAEEPSL